jgi:hypothetical protein
MVNRRKVPRSIFEQYENFVDESRSLPRVRCKHCQLTMVHHSSRMRDHLLNDCVLYKFHLEQQGRGSSPMQGTESFLSITSTDSIAVSEPAMPLARQKTRDLALCKWLYRSGIPFSAINEDFTNFVRTLSTSYHPPSARLLSGALLDEVYNDVEQRAME